MAIPLHKGLDKACPSQKKIPTLHYREPGSVSMVEKLCLSHTQADIRDSHCESELLRSIIRYRLSQCSLNDLVHSRGDYSLLGFLISLIRTRL